MMSYIQAASVHYTHTVTQLLQVQENELHAKTNKQIYHMYMHKLALQLKHTLKSYMYNDHSTENK